MRHTRIVTVLGALGIALTACGGGDNAASGNTDGTGGSNATGGASVGPASATGGAAFGGTSSQSNGTSTGGAATGGATSGGTATAVASAGGTATGGAGAGGAATGGVGNGGSASGGGGTGGAATGGVATGGAPVGGSGVGGSESGGAGTGGAATGGTESGGAAAGGNATGGAGIGGAATGGTESGGAAAGGSATGGAGIGGAATGGTESGGAASGGTATGGVGTGGAATGGAETGGAASGGSATGGVGTGGAATGGAGTGGSTGQSQSWAIEGCALTCDAKDDDGDGFSECQGDCNDGDASVIPLVADSAAAAGGDGSPAKPYQTITAAYAGLGSRSCRAIALRPGTYSDGVAGGTTGLLYRVTIASMAGPDTTFWQPAATNYALRGEGPITVRGITFRSTNGTTSKGILFDANSYACTDLTIENCIFDKVSRPVTIVECNGAMAFRCNIFRNNVASPDSSYSLAGAIMEKDSYGSHTYSILNNVFENNQSTGNGAAVAIHHTLGLIQGNRFLHNSTTHNGGAIYASNSGFAGDLRIRQNWFGGNQAASGAGVYLLAENANVYVENNVFDANIASGSGGGVCLHGRSGDTRRLANNTFVDNQAGLGGHAHLRLWVGEVFANIFAVTWGGGGVSADNWTNAADAPLLSYNDTYLNTPDYTGALAALTITGQNGNVSAVNPTFVDYSMDQNPVNDDLHLQSSSLLKNAGPCAPPTVWDVDGSCNDPGAYGGPGGSW